MFLFRFADVFKMDPDFLENEEKYKAIKKGELGVPRVIARSDLITFIITS